MRNIRTPNEFVIEDDICRIKLFYRSGKLKGEAIVDAEDYKIVKKHKWCLSSHGYVTSDVFEKGKRKRIYLHRIILNAQKGRLVDHKNLNKRDCRKENLRLTNINGNNQNISITKNNTSGFKGVCQNKKTLKWTAEVWKNGKKYYLGTFTSSIEAAKAYDKAALELHGVFAKTNKMLGLI